ncbi:MAG: alpha/beta hydrolase [Gammaproteobacteria bacterium]|nr:alpha/beta hydrolase [Gammaproteobacteria bacterium]
MSVSKRIYMGVRSVVITVISAYALVCVYLYFIQSELLYYPDIAGRTLRSTPENLGLDYEDINITTEDNIKLHGWFIPASKSKGTVLFFHGNAGNISHRLRSIRIFNNINLSVFIFDYRGYGQSEGNITEQGSYLDAEAAWFYLTHTRGIPEENIILFGRSLGGSIAARLASQYQPAAVIIESAFSSVPSMGSRLYPILPVKLLSRFEYNTEEYVKSVSAPVLIAHSVNDDIIPYEEGQTVFSAANHPKHFLEMRGGHNDGFVMTGEDYTEGIERFISRYLRIHNNKKIRSGM